MTQNTLLVSGGFVIAVMMGSSACNSASANTVTAGRTTLSKPGSVPVVNDVVDRNRAPIVANGARTPSNDFPFSHPLERGCKSGWIAG